MGPICCPHIVGPTELRPMFLGEDRRRGIGLGPRLYRISAASSDRIFAVPPSTLTHPLTHPPCAFSFLIHTDLWSLPSLRLADPFAKIRRSTCQSAKLKRPAPPRTARSTSCRRLRRALGLLRWGVVVRVCLVLEPNKRECRGSITAQLSPSIRACMRL